METNFLVYIISHITITGYKTKTTTALHAFKIHHKLSVVSGLNNACPYPEPALTHLSERAPHLWIIVYNMYIAKLATFESQKEVCTTHLCNLKKERKAKPKKPTRQGSSRC